MSDGVIGRARALALGWIARTRAKATGDDHREHGWDLARAFAIVMMVLINFQLMLAERPPATGLDHGEQVLRWLVHVPSGRSSSLFVVLAGVGFSLLTRRARERSGDRARDRTELFVAVRTMLLRVVFLFALGNALLLVWNIDILHFYACYLLLATLFLWSRDLRPLELPVAHSGAAPLRIAPAPGGAALPRRMAPPYDPWWFVVVGALATIGGAAVDVLLPGRAEVPYLTPLGLVLDLFLDGVHPVLPWFGFVAYGAWLGRRDLGDVARRRTFFWRAALLVVVTELGSLALGWAVLRVPQLALVRPHLGLLGTSWDPAPLFIVSACGTATCFVCIAHEITARFGRSLPVRALVHTGQLALTIYLTHAIVGVVLPRFFLGWGHSLSVAAVTAYWLAFVLCVIVMAELYRRVLPRGPLEWVMRTLTSWRLPSERAISAQVERAPLPPAGGAGGGSAVPWQRAASWVLVVLGATLLVFARIVGLGVGATDVITVAGASEHPGELTLVHPRRTLRIDATSSARVVIETRSGMDLYLELDRIDGATRVRVTEDDDGGEGLDARIDATLTPGTYELLVRPYGATTGPYVLAITPGA